MDRESADRTIRAGLGAAAWALAIFGLAFYVAVLYL